MHAPATQRCARDRVLVELAAYPYCVNRKMRIERVYVEANS